MVNLVKKTVQSFNNYNSKIKNYRWSWIIVIQIVEINKFNTNNKYNNINKNWMKYLNNCNLKKVIIIIVYDN